MEHTKKFVLVDPRFARPSMRDKALSGLDSDISSILESDEPDEIKARNYAATLSRFKNYSTFKPIKRKPATEQPKRDAKYDYLIELLKQKRHIQTPIDSIDQRSEFDYDRLFEDRDRVKSPDYDLNELFTEEPDKASASQAKAASLQRESPSQSSLEKLASSLQDPGILRSLGKATKSKEKTLMKWTKWSQPRRKSARKTKATKAWEEY